MTKQALSEQAMTLANAAIAHKPTAIVAGGGTLTAFYGGINANEIALIGGLILTAFGMLANIFISFYYKRKADRRAQEWHDKQMRPFAGVDRRTRAIPPAQILTEQRENLGDKGAK